MSGLSITDAIALENRPHMPDPADQQAYAEKHGDRSRHGWKELSDIQVASRARMLMRDDWTHEAVCTSVRDRICALALEKKALVEALAEMVRDAERNQRPGGGDVVPAKAYLALAKAAGQ